jgi:hypothetical protein
MLSGALWPGLGGSQSYLDVIGLNYYNFNQWHIEGGELQPSDTGYRALSQMLEEVYLRYERPLVIAETGAEGDLRRPWLAYVADEVFLARARGVPVEGLCLYPVLDYPGWANDRHCETGLLGYAIETRVGVPAFRADRPLYQPLADELAIQGRRFAQQRAPNNSSNFRHSEAGDILHRLVDDGGNAPSDGGWLLPGP